MLWFNIFWILYAVLWAAVVRYDVHMFQHNSYRVERYARWFRSGHKFGRAAVIAALAVVFVMFVLPMLRGTETKPYALYVKDGQLHHSLRNKESRHGTCSCGNAAR